MFATVLKYMYFCTIIEKILHNMRNFKKTIAVFSFFFLSAVPWYHPCTDGVRALSKFQD
jgi:hypothetical protein